MAKSKNADEVKVSSTTSRTNSDLDQAIQDLIERFSGRTRIQTRDPMGKVKILTATFGPRTAPSHVVEIVDFGCPEDPTSRETRLYEARVRQHEQRRLEIEEAVDKALRAQRERLIEASDLEQPLAPAPIAAEEKWSKRGLTALLGKILESAGSELNADKVEVNIAKGSNEIYLTQGDRVVKLNLSFPRAK